MCEAEVARVRRAVADDRRLTREHLLSAVTSAKRGDLVPAGPPSKARSCVSAGIVEAFEGALRDRAEPGRPVTFPEAGVRLRLARSWEDMTTGEAPYVVTPEATIRIRTQPLAPARTLEEAVATIQQSEAERRRMIKLWTPHALLEQRAWQTSSGAAGYRAVYGVDAVSPHRIAYFLLNRRGELLEVDVRFHAWDTDEYWALYDSAIRDGLELPEMPPP